MLNGSRSEFIRKCIVDRVNRKDKLSKLEKALKEQYFQRDLIDDEIHRLEEEKTELKKEQELNSKNERLIRELLEIGRTVAENEGLTEDRLIAIADDKIDYRILAKHLRDEGYKIGDEENIKKTFTKTKNGEYVAVKSYERKEKTSFETVFNLFKRNLKSHGHGKSPIDYLEQNKEHYSQMCKKYDDLTYDSFKKQLREYYLN